MLLVNLINQSEITDIIDLGGFRMFLRGVCASITINWQQTTLHPIIAFSRATQSWQCWNFRTA